MKISRDRLAQIIKEELDGMTKWDAEGGLMKNNPLERIKEIDRQIAELQAEKENLLMNVSSDDDAVDQMKHASIK